MAVGTGTGDYDYRPDVKLKDGERVEGKGWTLEAVHTPGHASNHLCYTLCEENVLFSGDQVMGWSTTVVSYPDGDMGDYISSLEKLLQRDEVRYWPNHGTCIEDPNAYVSALVAHRRDREDQIQSCPPKRAILFRSNGLAAGLVNAVPEAYMNPWSSPKQRPRFKGTL